VHDPCFYHHFSNLVNDKWIIKSQFIQY
jgi:hypothetical protein